MALTKYFTFDDENFTELINSQEFIDTPKIVTMGMIQHGKSAFIKSFTGFKDIEIGDGTT